MPRTRHAFTDPVPPVSRALREDVDIVLDDEAARAAAESLEVPHTTPEQGRRAALLVCELAGRGFDLENAQHRHAAARLARPTLEALGLVAPHDEEPADEPRGAVARGSGPRCGSITGYNDHRKAGEITCPACRAALADYHRGRRAVGHSS